MKKHRVDKNIIIVLESTHTHTEMLSLRFVVCELMFCIRQNGILGVERPSLNFSLSSHVLCQREETRSISWKSAQHFFSFAFFFFWSNPVHLSWLYFLVFFSLLPMSHFILLSLFQITQPPFSCRCHSCHHFCLFIFRGPIMLSLLSKIQLPFILQLWIIVLLNIFLPVPGISSFIFFSITVGIFAFPLIFVLQQKLFTLQTVFCEWRVNFPCIN